MSEVDNAPESPEIEIGNLAPDESIEESSTSETTGDQAPAAPKAKGVQRRLDELTAQRYAEQRAREDAQRDRDYWREVALKSQTPQEPEPAAQGKPNLADFSDYETFSEALASWKVEEILSQREAQAQQQRAQYEAMTVREAFDAKARSFEAQAPDWRQVVTAIPLSDAAFQAAQQSDMGPALLYHLGKNPQLAEQIYALTPYQQAMRLGRLELELSQPQPKRNSGAPPPIDPLGGGHEGVSADIYNDKLTDQQYFALREQQRNKRK